MALITNCQVCGPIDTITSLWETDNGEIAALLHPISRHEIRLHVHPQFRCTELENEILAHAEKYLVDQTQFANGALYLPVFTDDVERQKTLLLRGYQKASGVGKHWRRDLDDPLPEAPVPPGYVVRSMGAEAEHPARSWASWRAFHSDEPDENYDGDWSWYHNVQSAPLYRRDMDIVSATQSGEIAAFCTIYYDDYTRSAVCVLVGTAAEHWRRGLGKAVMIEGLQRLKKLGGKRVFATAYDPPADALYGSVMQTMKITETWFWEKT